MRRRKKGASDLSDAPSPGAAESPHQSPGRFFRRRWKFVFAVVFVTGALGGMHAWRQPPDFTESASSQKPAAPTISLGPLPLALPDEPAPPAHLTGMLEPIEWEPEDRNLVPERSAVIPPTLPSQPAPVDEPDWRPSTRTAEKPRSEPASEARRPVAPYRTIAATAKPPAQSPPPKPVSPAPPQAARTITHRIADGDTLASLAARYLGSASRWREIFAANRDRLANPDILPIGAELRIVVPITAPSGTFAPSRAND